MEVVLATVFAFRTKAAVALATALASDRRVSCKRRELRYELEISKTIHTKKQEPVQLHQGKIRFVSTQ